MPRFGKKSERKIVAYAVDNDKKHAADNDKKHFIQPVNQVIACCISCSHPIFTSTPGK